jgi:hypothetical protein
MGIMKGTRIMPKRVFVLTLALVLTLTTLAACGGSLSKPNDGSYKSEDGVQTWEFEEPNKITLIFDGLLSMKATYEIDDGEIFITTTGVLASTTSYAITEITAESFLIEGIKFTKQ